MGRKDRNTRVSTEYFDVRRWHKDNVSKALGNIKIHEMDIDRIIARKAREINMLDEILKKGEKKKK